MVIFQKANFRIREEFDVYYMLDDLKGDIFNPAVNTEISLETLKIQEKSFEDQIDSQGVYGYVLEKWNPSINQGWEQADACWGFIGKHKDEDHYIVSDFKQFVDEQIYLDWVNNFLSVAKFAEYYEMTEDEANEFINKMRDL